jgi:ubiquinone/menaquinone biosynthesis C-methylase UbiE
MTETRAGIDYDPRAASYAAHRRVNPAVVRALLESGSLGSGIRVLDVGCGTGNYAAALSAATGCRMSGIDLSAKMLERARDAAPWDALVQGSAESLPFADRSFDLVMTTDVIHHLRDRQTFFHEAARVLRPGGRIVTVTDSHEDIVQRRPLSTFFPETVDVQLRLYPPIPRLLEELALAGFTVGEVVKVSHPYELTDIEPYRDKAFSSLSAIDEDAFARGIARLEAALAEGPVPCVSRYTMIWGTLPASEEA